MNTRKADGLGRRDFIKTSAATALVGAVQATTKTRAATVRAGTPLTDENHKPGAIDWQLTRVRLDSRTSVRAAGIEGYCSKQSVLAGEALQIFVNTNPATKFTIEIFRTGYYGGRGARLMTMLGPFDGKKQLDPVMGEKRLLECRWEPSTTLTIPADWPSGVYLGRLTALPAASEKPYWQSYVVFIVRDTRPADILFQCSDNTWQAYNQWPNNTSLYTDPRGSHARGVAVSFDRPYGRQAQYTAILDDPLAIGAGEGMSFEYPLAYWLEQHGYDVTYCSNSDCLDAAQITRCKAFVSVGHDEYWDLRQYEAVKGAIAAGVNVLWLSGNACFGVSPFTPSSDGREKRIIERVGHYSGLPEADFIAAEKTFTKDYKRLGPDEGLIIGARTVTPANGGGDWTCTRPDHWIFEGTGMKKGDSIPGLVGWEHHGAPAEIPGNEVVAEGTVWSGGTKPSHYTATIFPGPKKNFVFNAASIFWVQGLSTPPGHMLPWSHWSRPHGPDERVQRITQNLLQRAIA
jgi:hypothetical protein